MGANLPMSETHRVLRRQHALGETPERKHRYRRLLRDRGDAIGHGVPSHRGPHAALSVSPGCLQLEAQDACSRSSKLVSICCGNHMTCNRAREGHHSRDAWPGVAPSGAL